MVIVGSRERGVGVADVVVRVVAGAEDDVEVAWGVVVRGLYVAIPAAWRLSGVVSAPVAVVLVVVSLARQGRRKVGGKGSGSTTVACHRVSSAALRIALIIILVRFSRRREVSAYKEYER